MLNPQIRGSLTVAVAALVLLVGAPTASAVVRYASPGGVTMGDCTSPDPMNPNPPCQLEHAVEFVAAPPDEVIASPGNYMLGANPLDINGDIDVHGAPGQPRPMLFSSANDAVTVSALGHLSDVRIEHSGPFNAVSVFDGTVERVIAHTGTGGSTACHVADGSLIRDSLCWTEAGGGAGQGVMLAQGGAVTLTARLRNVTAAATGLGGDGIFVEATNGGNNTIQAKNVIALGAGTDALANTEAVATATLTFEYSNYDSEDDDDVNGATVTDPGTGTGNQIAAPLFVNQAVGDFHQLAVSPTVNEGAVVDLIGTADFDGDPRTLGAAPDIGADEFVPPATVTPTPTPTTPLAPTTPAKKKCKKGRKLKKGKCVKKKRKKRKKRK